MKALLGITPSGVVSFDSELFPGSTSDKKITIQSGLQGKLRKGGEIMAYKRFNCQDELASIREILVTPKFLKDKGQFSTKETEDNKTSLCVQVETLMEPLNNWPVFYHKIPISLAPIKTLYSF